MSDSFKSLGAISYRLMARIATSSTQFDLDCDGLNKEWIYEGICDR